VRLRGTELFVVRTPFGTLSPAERAERASRRLEEALLDPRIGPEQVIVVPSGADALIKAGELGILEVTAAEAAAHDSSPGVLADLWAGLIRQELGRRKSEAFSLVLVGRFLLGTIYPIGILLALWVGLILLHRAREWAGLLPESRLPVLKILDLELLGPFAARRLLLRLLGLLRAVLVVGLGYAFLLALFGQFPQTRTYVRGLLHVTLEALGRGLAEILSWMPRLLAALVILLAARLMIRLAGLIFSRVRAGRLAIPPLLTAETATVSEAILRALVVLLATTLLALLVPGESGWPVLAILFFIGLGAALALAPAARQMAAGILLAYVQVAPCGSRIEVDGASGRVSRRGIFHTIVVTDAGEECWIPNHSVLTRRLTRHAAGDPRGGADGQDTPSPP
jgi:small-conductance mechanosensitive channel